MGVETDQLLGDRYRLLDRIAGGGMGEVWRALDEVLGREVAVKVLRREYADDPTFLQRFRAEARHSANLAHPGIAAVYDFGEGSQDPAQGTPPFLVMENVPGEPLSALIGREGALGPERTLDIVGQAAYALQAAHDAGVIHRDVKPGNLLVTPSGMVKITDFGIARATNSVPLTQTGAIMGTAHYISPEQASGGSVTPASDIYSLGIVAYECLTGQRPFAGDTPVSVALAQVRDEPPALPDTVPEPVRALVMTMLAKEPEQRPADAGVVGDRAAALRPGLVQPPDQVAPTMALTALPVVGGVAAAETDHPTYDGESAATVAVPSPAARHHPDTDPGFHLPTPSRLPSWLPYAVALVLFALLFLGLRACSQDPSTVGTVGSPSDSSAPGSAPATVEVADEDYLGRPVAEVSSELEDLGLRVAVDQSVGGGEVDTVKQVAPTGALAVGTLVRLGVVAPDEIDEDDDESRDRPGKGKGNSKRKDD